MDKENHVRVRVRICSLFVRKMSCLVGKKKCVCVCVCVFGSVCKFSYLWVGGPLKNPLRSSGCTSSRWVRVWLCSGPLNCSLSANYGGRWWLQHPKALTISTPEGVQFLLQVNSIEEKTRWLKALQSCKALMEVWACPSLTTSPFLWCTPLCVKCASTEKNSNDT